METEISFQSRSLDILGQAYSGSTEAAVARKKARIADALLALGLPVKWVVPSIEHFSRTKAMEDIEEDQVVAWVLEQTGSDHYHNQPVLVSEEAFELGSDLDATYPFDIKTIDREVESVISRNESFDRLQQWLVARKTSNVCETDIEDASLLVMIEECLIEDLPLLALVLDTALIVEFSRAVSLGLMKNICKTNPKSIMDHISESPKQTVLLVEYLKLVLFRGPTLFDFNCVVTTRPLGLQDHSEIVIQSILYQILDKEGSNCSLLRLLAETSVNICRQASGIEYYNVRWGGETGLLMDLDSRATGLSIMLSDTEHLVRWRSTLREHKILFANRDNLFHGPPHFKLSDSDALTFPNVEWSIFILNSLLNCKQSEYSLSLGIYSSKVYHAILKLGLTCSNVSLKDACFRICSRVLSYVSINSSSVANLEEYYSDTPEKEIVHLFTTVSRKEISNCFQHSAYLKSITAWLTWVRRLKNTVERSDPLPASMLRQRSISQQLLLLYVANVSHDSITVKWSSDLFENISKIIEDETHPKKESSSPTNDDERMSRSDSITSEDGGNTDHTRYQLVLEYRVGYGYALKSLDDIADAYDDYGQSDTTTKWKILTDKSLESKLTQYTFHGVSPDTPYQFRIGVKAVDSDGCDNKPIWGPIRRIDTQLPPLFKFSASSCGPNLSLSEDNLTATNKVNKKWNMVRISTGFKSGTHTWHVHINKCVSKNIFVGVVGAHADISNYVGADKYGWGYLANKAVWHNKGKVKTYGELYKEGDTITVTLDVESGTLAFARNGNDMGIGFDGLDDCDEYFPAVSLYNLGDQISIKYADSEASLENRPADNNHEPSKGTSCYANGLIGRMVTALQIVSSLESRKNDVEVIPLPKAAIYRVAVLTELGLVSIEHHFPFSAKVGAAAGGTLAPSILRKDQILKTSPWGNRKVMGPDGEFEIVGIGNGKLFYKLPDAESKQFHACLSDMHLNNDLSVYSKGSMSAYGGTGSVCIPWSSDSPGMIAPPISNIDEDVVESNTESIPEAFFEDLSASLQSWTIEADKQLVALVDSHCITRSISFQNVDFLNFETPPTADYPALAGISSKRIQERLVLLIYLNKLLLQVWPLFEFDLPENIPSEEEQQELSWSPGQLLVGSEVIFLETKLAGIATPLQRAHGFTRNPNNVVKIFSDDILDQLSLINYRRNSLAIEFQDKVCTFGFHALERIVVEGLQEAAIRFENNQLCQSENRMMSVGCIIGIAIIAGVNISQSDPIISIYIDGILSPPCNSESLLLIRRGISLIFPAGYMRLFHSTKCLKKILYGF